MTDAPPLVLLTSDLATFLGIDVDEERAQMMLELAQQACATIVTLTADAKFAVLGVAARVYSTPVPVASQTTGPYSVGGTVGGISLTRAEERALRRLAGGGGAFAFSPLAADAGTNLPVWDTQGVPTVSTS